MTKFIISAARPAECRSPVPAKAVRRPCRVRRSDRGHEHFGDADPVDEAFRRHATTPKSVAHVPIFADIAVDAGLVFQNRHQALLCVLLFDEILSLSSDDGARQEHLEPPGQRVELAEADDADFSALARRIDRGGEILQRVPEVEPAGQLDALGAALVVVADFEAGLETVV